MRDAYYTTWVYYLVPCYFGAGAYVAWVLCRCFRRGPWLAVGLIPVLASVLVGALCMALLRVGFHLAGADAAHGTWALGQFREASIVAFVATIPIVLHALRRLLDDHPRIRSRWPAKALNSPAMEAGLIFAFQCLLVFQALKWPWLKVPPDWAPAWWHCPPPQMHNE